MSSSRWRRTILPNCDLVAGIEKDLRTVTDAESGPALAQKVRAGHDAAPNRQEDG